MDARWAKFDPADGRLGVTATFDGLIVVPHQYKDRMNAVAFYVALNRDALTTRYPGDIVEVDNALTMSRGTFGDLLAIVEHKIGVPPEPQYSGPVTLCEVLTQK